MEQTHFNLGPQRNPAAQATAVLLTVLIVCPGALAQADGALGKSDWNNLGSLQSGQKVEVVRSNLSKHKGKFVTWSEEALVLRTKKRNISIPRDEVFRVTLLAPPRRRNALIGMGVGLVPGIVIGSVLYRRIVNEHGVAEARESVAILIAFGAGVGAGIGAILPGHQTVYRAKKKPRALRQLNPGSPSAPKPVSSATSGTGPELATRLPARRALNPNPIFERLAREYVRSRGLVQPPTFSPVSLPPGEDNRRKKP